MGGIFRLFNFKCDANYFMKFLVITIILNVFKAGERKGISKIRKKAKWA